MQDSRGKPQRSRCYSDGSAHMTRSEIAQLRLRNQHLVSPKFTKPADVVKWFGAMQAQDYAGAKWTVGQRMIDATDATITDAFARGTILRTHVMRSTWHFVVPTDIRWMLQLTAPRVKSAVASYCRKHGLDERLFQKTNKILARALQGGHQLTRDALRDALARADIVVNNLQFMFVLMRAEVDAVVCSGPREGKQFTYMLLDDRAPEAKALARDEALVELTWRYFRSHGPATLADFIWWSGLLTRDAKSGIQMLGKRLTTFVAEEKTYWMAANTDVGREICAAAYLLPTYDEYLIAYKDRSASIDAGRSSDMRLNPKLISHVLVGGKVIGHWKGTANKTTAAIELGLFEPAGKREKRAIAEAASRYGAFLGVRAEISD
jgi:hypothetical protein